LPLNLLDISQYSAFTLGKKRPIWEISIHALEYRTTTKPASLARLLGIQCRFYIFSTVYRLEVKSHEADSRHCTLDE
jgi:hypothetical protein